MAHLLLHRRVMQKQKQKFFSETPLSRCLRDLADGRHLDRWGLRIKKLKGHVIPVFEARVTQDVRLIFTKSVSARKSGQSGEGDEYVLVWDVDHHDDALKRSRRYAYDAFLRQEGLSLASYLHTDSSEEVDEGLPSLPEFAFVPFEPNQDLHAYLRAAENMEDAFEKAAETLEQQRLCDAHEWFEVDLEAFDAQLENWIAAQKDFALHLTEEQQKWVHQSGPLLLEGSVGSGKTTILMYHLLRQAIKHPEGRFWFFTYSPTLRGFCQHLFSRLPHAERVLSRIEILDYAMCLERIASENGLSMPSLVSYEETAVLFKRFLEGIQGRWKSRALPKEFLPLVQQHSKMPWSSEQIWAEVWDILQGKIDFRTQRVLDLEGYQQERADIDVASRPFVFWLREQFFARADHHDELTLTRDLWGRWVEGTLKLPTVQGIYIDEAQDLTEIQWMLLLKMLPSYLQSGLVMAGDPFQALRPSGFHWRRLQARLQEQTAIQSGWLRLNLRNSRSIAKFVQVQLERISVRWAVESPNYEVSAKLEGPPVALLEMSELSHNLCAQWLRGFGAVLVADTAMKSEEALGVYRDVGVPIWSIEESKGLEFDRVLLWRVGESLEKAVTRERSARQEMGRLYVAMTRARLGLLVVETSRELPFWKPEALGDWGVWLAEPTSAAVWWETWQAVADPPSLCASWSMQNEHPEQYAVFLFERGLREEAARSFEAAGRWDALARCYEKVEEWEEAARCYEKAEKWEDMARCYEKGGKWGEAARCYEKGEKWGEAARCYEKGRSGEKLPVATKE